MQYKKYAAVVNRLQRKLAIGISRAYRTVSLANSLVFANIPPLDLVVKQRASTWGKAQADKKYATEETMRLWQDRWEKGKSPWTRKLIPDLKAWSGRKFGVVIYHRSQMLLGHGCYMAYLHRMRRRDTEECMYSEEQDTVEHTVFHCRRWKAMREPMQEQIGRDINTRNLVEIILSSEEAWNAMPCMSCKHNEGEGRESVGKSTEDDDIS